MSSPITLSPEDNTLIARAQRLVVNITDARVAAKAARAGYDEAEHREGCRLLQDAAGLDRPFSHFVSAAALEVESERDQRARLALRDLDAFENTWFPRARYAIRRYVKAPNTELVERAFFDGMKQEPQGPKVVLSVEKLLERFAGLATTDKPGAREAHGALVKKGLDATTVGRIKALIDETRTLTLAPAPAVPAAEQAAADAKQRAALGSLKLWYQDWAETLRSELPHNDLVKLGLRQVTKRAAEADEIGEPEV